MRVKVINIPVQSQEKTLGFIKKLDIPLSENNRWLTMVAKKRTKWYRNSFGTITR